MLNSERRTEKVRRFLCPNSPNVYILPLIFTECYDKITTMNTLIFKNIKKLAAVILAAAMLLMLSACSPGSSENMTEPPETTSNVVRVTFPEGSSVAQIARLLEENGVCSAADFMSEANNPLNLEGTGFSIPNPEERSFLLEGYVFPDTYEFYRNESASSAIKRFLKNTQSKLTDDMLARCDELGYTVDEILTLASIIQEEAGDPAEMGKVSSVLHNRLNSSDYPRLQCDVATFYLRDYVKPYVDEVRYEELAELYNTYNCDGLPAGPITNVGTDAVNAALYPEDTDFYFFVTDTEGNYLYAETWAEHQENCDIAGL